MLSHGRHPMPGWYAMLLAARGAFKALVAGLSVADVQGAYARSAIAGGAGNSFARRRRPVQTLIGAQMTPLLDPRGCGHGG
jgi:hypothetical protein